MCNYIQRNTLEVLRNGVAPSCVRMKKCLPSHALNNRENFSPTELEWDPGNTAMCFLELYWDAGHMGGFWYCSNFLEGYRHTTLFPCS